MRGTEKQVAWATDIINKVVPVMEQVVIDIRNTITDEEKKNACIAGYEQRITALKEAEYAGDVIAILGDVRLSGDHRKDIRKIVAAYRVTPPATDGMKKILGK